MQLIFVLLIQVPHVDVFRVSDLALSVQQQRERMEAHQHACEDVLVLDFVDRSFVPAPRISNRLLIGFRSSVGKQAHKNEQCNGEETPQQPDALKVLSGVEADFVDVLVEDEEQVNADLDYHESRWHDCEEAEEVVYQD